ncbi:MAG TPA: aldose epimerase family protein [Negativicutes bacterium]|nr:aldose epimerase family protein [Negativicutes bacterium]
MYCISNIMKVNEREVALITLVNRNNVQLRLINYGAVIYELIVPDREGNLENIVLSYEDPYDYIKNKPYFGAVIGRTSGRIGGAAFTLSGEKYELTKNDGENNLHGGPGGFSFKLWDYSITEGSDSTSVEFTYLSRDMEEGYPGNLTARVIYTLTDKNELIIEYKATTDRDTLCNLTNHSYFNLSGNYKRKISEQYLRFKSDSFVETDKALIPTGRLVSVEGTPMDFNTIKAVGRDIEMDYSALAIAGGYDQPWMLSAAEEQIELYDEISGRRMTVSTSYPCVVIYTYNFANNEKLKYGKLGSKYDGICFETQYEPDGINHQGMHNAILAPGDCYNEKTIFRFDVL